MPRGAFAHDLEKYYRIDCDGPHPTMRQRFRLWAGNFGLHCVAVYRYGQWARRFHRRHRLLGLLPRALHALLHFGVRVIHHVELNVADIGPGLYIGHASSLFVGADSIGDNFSVTHNVTIGQGHSHGGEGKPSIGNNVWVGTGAVVAGAIHVGDNVTISPGTFLSRTIPDACLVGGNPGRVLANNYNNDKLLSTDGGGAYPNREGTIPVNGPCATIRR